MSPADRMCPLKVGDELFIDEVDAPPIPNMEFVFEIGISEPGIVEGDSLIETIERFAEKVSGVILDFRAQLNP